jgi:hypothetical protein
MDIFFLALLFWMMVKFVFIEKMKGGIVSKWYHLKTFSFVALECTLLYMAGYWDIGTFGHGSNTQVFVCFHWA